MAPILILDVQVNKRCSCHQMLTASVLLHWTTEDDLHVHVDVSHDLHIPSINPYLKSLFICFIFAVFSSKLDAHIL